jgi:hypothetical protein
MEIFPLLATSWPFWLSIVLIVFLVIFRSGIASLIVRIRSIGTKGVAVRDHLEQKPQPATDPREAADQLLTQLNVNQYVLAQQQAIVADLKAKNLPIDSETARVLLGYTSALFVALNFERIYSSIWGSQLMILNFLNSRISVSRGELQPYYEIGRITNPEAFESYPFETYIDFLLSQGLIQQQGDRCSITPKGRTFLIHLVNQGLTQNKAG